MMMMKMVLFPRQWINSEALLTAETTLITTPASLSAPHVNAVVQSSETFVIRSDVVNDFRINQRWQSRTHTQTHTYAHTHTHAHAHSILIIWNLSDGKSRGVREKQRQRERDGWVCECFVDTDTALCVCVWSEWWCVHADGSFSISQAEFICTV